MENQYLPIRIDLSNLATAAESLRLWQETALEECRKTMQKILDEYMEEMFQKALNGKPFDKK